MTILAADPSIPGDFDCVLSDECGTVTTTTSVVQCPADFDLNGFVNGEDFDSYRERFIAGDPSSDINRDGFVSGEDIDYFMEHFVAGC